MLNRMIGMIAGGIIVIGAVVTLAPDSAQVTNSLARPKKSDVVMVAPLPFLTDDTGMRMRAVYGKPAEQQKIIAVTDRPIGNTTSLTVISPYLTPEALRAAIRAGWTFPDEDE